MSKHKKDYFEIKWKTNLPYRYSIGNLSVKFFEELKENKKIFGSKCPRCGKVHFPPRGVCAECMVEMKVENMIQLYDTGTLVGFTVINYPFVDPQTGGIRPFPYGYGLFKLDGADTYTMHFIDETDVSKLKVGMRVKAVYKEERDGNLGDIPYFKIIKERPKPKRKKVEKMEEEIDERLVYRGRIKVPYKHVAGAYVEKFITEIDKNQRIMGTKCPKCGKVYVPPRMICVECFEKMEEWVEVDNKGTVKGFTVVSHSTPVMPLEPPFAYALITLDGSNTEMVHIIKETDPKKLKEGMRVEAVFKEKPRKRITDIEYFKVIE
jgi:uncharacterized OB-fold protein